MNSKRIISLILSIVMTLQIFVFQTPVHAMEGANPTIQKSEGQKTSERTEEFAFKNTKKPKLTWFRRDSQPLFGARDVSTTKTETLKISTTATGLDEGVKPFDWAAFGQNKKFRAWIEVAYEEDKKPGEKVATERHKVSEDFDISAEGDIEATATLDASKTVDYYFLKTEYDTDDAAFRINAVLEYAGSLSPKNTSNLEFSVDIHQIVSTKITYNLIDEYGKTIDLTDTKEEKPADTDLENLGKIGDVTTFNLKNEGEEILWQDQKLDEFDLMDSSLTMSLTKNEIKSKNIDYKLSSTYDVLNGGKVTIQRQKDAVTPKDPQKPGDIPEGYARINLSADATGAGPTGTFTKDDSTDNRRVVDVKAGKPYTSAKAEVNKVTKPFPLTSEKKVDTGKTFDKWTPELGTLGNAVAKETKTLNATYKSSDKEIIPYLPTEPVPTEDENGLPIPTNFVTVTFKSEDAAKGKVKIGDKEGATVLAKVKPGIDLSKKAEITTVPAENYGFTEWKPALTKAAADQTYTAYFVKSGDKINEGDPIPKGWLKVTVSQDESIVDNTVEKAIYTVKSGDKLSKDKFADLKGKAKDGYKDPAWYVGSEKLEKPYEKEITTSTDFLASATEEIANKFKTNGLKAVDITAYKGDKIEGKFWNKGVTVQREDAVLERLIEAATVTDITETKRTTDNAGTFPGTLKVTFEDGSSLEVQNQRLIVIDTKVDIDYGKDSDKDANAPRHKDEVVKGKIKSGETLEGAKVEILDKDNNVIGITLADKNGSFIAGTRPLKTGETIKVRVTLQKAGKASPAVEKVVGLNPDELNNILPTADKVYENFNGKPGVSKDKVDKLQEAIKAGKALIDAKTKKAASTVPVTDKGQGQLDTAYENIKAAIEALTENQIPMINAPDHKEIFVGGEIDLDKDVKVVDDNIKQVDGKDYTYKIYDASGAEVEKSAMVAKDGVYRVVYSAEDAQGVKASHTMTVVVKKTVVEVPGEFPTPTPEGYIKVEFKSGEHAGLNGVSKFLVKKDAPKSAVKEPEIIPKEGYKVAEPKWSVAIPDTFAKDFETEAQVLAKVTTDKPADKDKDKYAKLTFEAGDHGKFEKNAKTTIYVLKNEEVKFNAPKIEANEGFTFAEWNPELKTKYDGDANHVAQYASNSDVSDTEVKGFQEVKFVAGNDGHFGNDVKEKSVWVRPGKLVDLRTKAPKVTVTTEGKSFIGWDQDLVQKFTKADTATVINARYDDTVKTTKPTENVDKYAKVDFLAGNLGTIAADATKTYWVVKDAEVTLTPPTVTAKDGWKVKAEKPWDPTVATKYTQDTIHLAQYDYDGASVVPQKPGDEKPNVPDNFVKVEFKEGEHGVISSEENFIYWVDPTKEVKITAPAVIADTNYKHDGWKNGDAVVDLTKANKFETATDLVAQYKSTVVTEDPKDENYVTVEFNAKDHGTLEGTAKFWVYKNEKVSITAPTVTAKDGYTFDKWDPAVKDSYAEATVHNATYTTNNNVSDTEVEGYNKVIFKAGEHGTLTEKSVWVKPDTLVDLNDKAPEVTPEKGYSHIGWKPGLVGKFKNNTDIVAQYTEEKTPEPTVTARNIGTEGPDGKRVPATKTTVEIETVPKAKVTIEYTDKDGQPQKIENLTAGEDGKLTQEITPKLDKDTPVKVTVQDGEKQPTDKIVKVFDDLDDNKIPDNQAGQTERPAAIASNKGKTPTFTTIEGKTEKGATITVTVKVNGEEKPVTVENLKVNDDGTYTLEAKYDNKPLENGAEILVYAQNKPKTKSAPQTTTVFNDFNNDGKPDGGKVDLTDVKDIQVIAPEKMSYTQGEKLVGTGLKAVIRDNKGGIEIFDYDNATGKFKNADNEEVADITATVANKPIKDLPLTEKDHNGKAIDVKVGQAKCSTNQTLEVKQLQTPTPTIEFAANQNTVGSTGQATQTAKQKTTVKFTVKNKPTTVYVKYTVNGEAKEESFDIGANDELTKTVDLAVKLPVGAEVKVLAKDADKTLSEAATAKVVRDANNDGTPDDKTPVGKATIDPIKAQSEKITVKPADNATELVITETDKSGNTPDGSTPIVIKQDKDGNWKIGKTPVEKDEETGKLTIPKGTFKLDEYNVVEVESKGDPDTTTPSIAKEVVGKAKDTTAPAMPVVDQPVDGDKDIKVKTPTEPDAKTITVEVTVPAKPGEKPTTKTVEVTKGDDGKWKTKDGKDVPEENGKLVIPVDPAVKTGDKVTVEVKDDSGNGSKTKPKEVIARQQLPGPTINPIKTGEKTVAGKAENAATVDIYKKNAEGKYEPLAKDVGVSPDGSYTYNNADGFKDGDVIRVVAKKPGMTDAAAEATVGVDTSGLDKAITDGKGELEKRKDGTPADKALEDAIKEGEDLKKRDPAPSQEEVDKAKDKIEKAIEDKKAYDDAKDKLKEKIKEAEDKKNDPEYPTKPDYAKKELEESATEGTNVDNDKTSSKESIDKAIEKIQEKLDQYNKQQIGASIYKVRSNDKNISVVVTAPDAKVEVFKVEFDYSTFKTVLIPIGEKTDLTRLLVVSMKDTLPSGTNLLIRVTHPDYLSFEDTITVE